MTQIMLDLSKIKNIMDKLYFKTPQHLRFIQDPKEERWYSIIDMQICAEPHSDVLQKLEIFEHNKELSYTLCFSYLSNDKTPALSQSITSLINYFKTEKLMFRKKLQGEEAFCIEQIKIDVLKAIIRNPEFQKIKGND